MNVTMINTGKASLIVDQLTFFAFSNSIIPIIRSTGDVPAAGVDANIGQTIADNKNKMPQTTVARPKVEEDILRYLY